MNGPLTELSAANVRFGVLGTGRITRRIVAELQQSGATNVAAIGSRELVRGRWFADQFGIARALGSYQELIESPEIDAVYIALPPALHHEWAMRAVEQGKHVLCEKPLMVDAGEALELDTLASKQGVYWLDATGWLHHPRTKRMAEHLQSGRLGELRHVSTAVSFFEPFQTNDHRLVAELGGGCLLDLGWYAVGFVLWSQQQCLPTRVSALGQQRDGVWRRVTAMMEFANGVTATAHCAYDVATRKWMEIAGHEASIVCDDFTRPWVERPTRFWIHDRAGSVVSEAIAGQQEREMVIAFAEEIRGAQELSWLRRQAIQTQQLLAAITDALRTGQTVELPQEEKTASLPGNN
jgi:predicted dehydrogenase